MRPSVVMLYAFCDLGAALPVEEEDEPELVPEADPEPVLLASLALATTLAPALVGTELSDPVAVAVVFPRQKTSV